MKRRSGESQGTHHGCRCLRMALPLLSGLLPALEVLSVLTLAPVSAQTRQPQTQASAPPATPAPALAPTSAPAATAGQVLSLRSAFDAAWERQPDAKSLPQRRAAGAASVQAAQAWTAEPAALEWSLKTGQLGSNSGNVELVVGLSAPLWLPGERARSIALATAEQKALNGRLAAAQWRIAGAVREAWWAAHLAGIDASTAQARLRNARQLIGDVARRVQAGDMSRADRHQAEASLAAAQAEAASATAAYTQALQGLRALVGLSPPEPLPSTAETEPAESPERLLAAHPLLRELAEQAEVTRRSRELAGVQTRASPEVELLATRERGAFGEPFQQSITVALKVPFASGARRQAKAALAAAAEIEAEALLANEQGRLAAEAETASARLAGARLALEAAERRAALTRETRGFYEGAFRLGQADLPTRLRIELDASEAERQAARARVELARAISSARQALGLLPN